MKGSKAAVAGAAIVLALGVSACARTKEVVRIETDPALTERIEKAEFAALEAQRLAAEAQQTALEAKARADAANTAAQTSDERVNRAFERSQEK